MNLWSLINSKYDLFDFEDIEFVLLAQEHYI